MDLSIIIPAYNAEQHLKRCLGALASSPDASREIIVVDDGSTDSSRDVARELGATVLAMDTRGGPALARNRGAHHATGEILWFLDADIEVHPDAQSLVLNYFREHPDEVAVIGSYDDSPSDPGLVSQFKNLFHHFVHQESVGPVSSFWTGCGAIRRKTFLELGGFDAARWNRPAIEDIHFGYAISGAGHNITILKELQVKHHKRWTLVSLVRTDLFDRAIPWTTLLLANRGRGSSELNLSPRYRICVASIGLAILALFGGFFFPLLWIAIPFLLAVPVILNFRLISFFSHRRGSTFASSTIPLLWLYFFYCGLGFVLGLLSYLREKPTQRFSPNPPNQD